MIKVIYKIKSNIHILLFIIAILKSLLENSDASTADNSICWLSVIDECKFLLDVDK